MTALSPTPNAEGGPTPVLVRTRRSTEVRRRRVHRAVAGFALAALAIGVAGCSGDDGSSPPETTVDADTPLRVESLAGPARYATGGTALIGIDSPRGDTLDGVTVEVAGADVTAAFHIDDDPHRLEGASPRLIGLLEVAPGATSTVTARRSGESATLEVTDNPVQGPLFSGPHQSPFVCTTERAGLDAPGDECSASSQQRWMYVKAGGGLVDLADPTAVPSDVAMTTTTEGSVVPFVVRIETLVLNRSIVTVALLDPRPTPIADTPDPTVDPDVGSLAGPAWDPSGWNGRLVVRFGGGCGATYSQGTSQESVLDTEVLGRGYALASGTLLTFDTACNAVVSAETAMVVKEHVAKTYGPPRHTIGQGGSGGAVQQLQIVQQYPGILDAIAPSIPFADAVSLAGDVTDCGLLQRWFGGVGGSAGIIPNGQPSGRDLTEDQRRAITGFASTATCGVWTETFLDTVDPTDGCARELVNQVFDLVTRPRGVRCTFQDSNVNILGIDPTTGFAQRPLDNVGVQYGLQALAGGVITVDQFLDLNEGIGGYDINGGWQAARERADDEALARAYRSGMVTAGSAPLGSGDATVEGHGGIEDVPIILTDVYTDEFGDIHDRQRAFAIRDRLRAPDGRDDPNLVIWTQPVATSLSDLIARVAGGNVSAVEVGPVLVLDDWLTAAEQTPASDGSWADRLAAARPASAADRCVLPDRTEVSGPGIYDPGTPCTDAYPLHASPRQVAGAPRSGEILACSLVDVDPEAYGVELSESQRQRLQSVFPDGVCDWSASGRGEGPPVGTWPLFDGS